MKKIHFCILLMLCFCFLTACGDKKDSFDGKWVLSQRTYADGTAEKGDDLNVYECYQVDGEKASYTVDADVIGKKNIELIVEKISDDEYNFKITEKQVFSTAKLDGNTFTYTLGADEDDEDAVILTFEKQK